MGGSPDDFVRAILHEHDGGQAVDAEAPLPVEAPEPTGLEGHTAEGLVERGGSGAVDRAPQAALDREVAVKVLASRARAPELARRFRREALLLARLAHPNIVPIHDLGVDGEGHPPPLSGRRWLRAVSSCASARTACAAGPEPTSSMPSPVSLSRLLPPPSPAASLRVAGSHPPASPSSPKRPVGRTILLDATTGRHPPAPASPPPASTASTASTASSASGDPLLPVSRPSADPVQHAGHPRRPRRGRGAKSGGGWLKAFPGMRSEPGGEEKLFSRVCNESGISG